MAQDAVVRLKQGEEEEFIEFLLNNRAHAHDLHFDCMHNDACEWARPEPDNYPPELEPFDLDHVPLELHPLAWWLLVLPIPLLLGLVAWVLYLGLHKRRYADAKRVLATWINVPNLNILISVTGKGLCRTGESGLRVRLILCGLCCTVWSAGVSVYHTLTEALNRAPVDRVAP